MKVNTWISAVASLLCFYPRDLSYRMNYFQLSFNIVTEILGDSHGSFTVPVYDL